MDVNLEGGSTGLPLSSASRDRYEGRAMPTPLPPG